MVTEIAEFFVVVDEVDHFIAGTLGDVYYLTGESEYDSGKPTCVISTDDPEALMKRLDKDDNVSSYERVYEDDER